MAIKKRSTCICQHTELRTVGLCWSKVLLPKYPCRWQQCNRRHQTSPTVCDPTPSRPLKDSSNACNQASAPIVCMPLCGPVQFAIHRVLGLLGTCFPPKCPFPFGDRHPHVTHCSWGQAHSQSQWGRKPQNFPFPLGFHHPAGGGLRHGHKQHAQKIGKDLACGYGDILADRKTHRHTNVLITILCNQCIQIREKTQDFSLMVLPKSSP